MRRSIIAYAKRPALWRAAVLRVLGTLSPALILGEIRNHRDVDVLPLIGLDAPIDTDGPHDERGSEQADNAND